MLFLFETAAGYALFKVVKEGKLEKAEDLSKDFETLDSAQKIVKLKAFSKFQNTTEALAAATALVDSKLDKGLKKFLKKNAVGETLAVLDAKLGSLIKDKLDIPCVYSAAVQELARGVRAQLSGLISGLAGSDLTPMSLGLSHSLSRYKLKFSPDKVDTMIVQAIGLLDDLDKELNTYAMRVREWYGWHFPEMTKIVGDNIAYAKAIKLMGTRDRSAGLDFSGVLEEEVEAALKEAAQISMGTEISAEDLENIQALSDQVIELSEYRGQLFDYLKSRMAAIAPNLTVLVGELVGARLIAHAGSLINLAKQPASTVQILGAEKALFRALKTKHETPKYGLIYHASLIGQSQPKFKGKISRVLAAKCSLAIRVDALGDSTDATVGMEAREKVEARLRQLEGRSQAGESGKPRGKADTPKYDKSRQGAVGALATTPKAYNPDADVAEAPKSKKKKEKEANGEADGSSKKKKDKKRAAEEDGAAEEPAKKKKKEKKEKKEKKAKKGKGSDSD
ncbi:MAG: MAR-binding protein [Monoraphidium minutum]|nr:MAG: MAR-binding protein [Monoraphidium minutum]